MHGSGADLTPAVQTGLAWFYLIACLANVAFGLALQIRFKRASQALVWYAVAAVFAVHAALYFLHQGPTMPHWLRDLADQGLQRGLITLGLAPDRSAGLVTAVNVLVGLLALLGLADGLFSYAFGRPLNKKVAGMMPADRLVFWSLLVAALALVAFGTNAITFFVLSMAGFAALIVWRRTLTQPGVAWAVLNLGLLFGGWSMTDSDFRHIIVKPDNIPIVGLVGVVGYFTWLAFRKAVLNDERIAQGKPVAEKEEDEKVLVWPDLVYTELICMVVVTVVLIVWAVALPAPLEQPANSTKTPNPSKAPWYFLGLQEMLVYYDPWFAGVVSPTIIILGLIAIPYIDFNKKGNGYYTFAERPFAIVTFLFGFIVLWVTLIFLGTFLRGPNWNFFGPYEPWDPHKLVPLNNVNLSDYVWIRGLGKIWEHPSDGVSIVTIVLRESPGILLVLAYFLVLPPLLARTVLRKFYIHMGFVRYIVLVTLLLFMMSFPIKMVLRWTINLKYIVAIPEFFFNL
jgi:hypothetical protein